MKIQEQREKKATYMREWRKNNPEYRIKHREYNQNYMNKPGIREKKNEQNKHYAAKCWVNDPEYREHKRIYKQTPIQKEKARARKNTEYYRAQQREYRKKEWRTPRGRFNDYKSKAKQRNIEFLLSLEEFTIFWQIPCHYCGSEIEYVGIDRNDNNKGYAIDNVVPCCEICNEMKLHYTQEFFYNHCSKIVKHRGLAE